MTGIYGVNLTGLKRQPTFDEVIGIENFKPKYPDRRNKFLRNSPMMTQFDNIGAFELEEYYNREMVQRQMHDLISSIAKSSDLTFNEVKTISKGIGKISPKFDMGTRVDMEGAKAELEEIEKDEYELQLLKTQQGKAAFKEGLGQPPEDDYSIVPDDDAQPGASSSSKPEDRQSIVEGAINVFRQRQSSKVIVPGYVLTHQYVIDSDAKSLEVMHGDALIEIARYRQLRYSVKGRILKKEELIKSIMDHDQNEL